MKDNNIIYIDLSEHNIQWYNMYARLTSIIVMVI